MDEIASATNRVEKADSKAEAAMLMDWYNANSKRSFYFCRTSQVDVLFDFVNFCRDEKMGFISDEIESATNPVEKAEVDMLLHWYTMRTRNACSIFVQLIK